MSDEPAAAAYDGELLPEDVLARHLQPIRGLALAQAIFAGFQIGVFDALARGPVAAHDVAAQLELDEDRLDGYFDYLENEGLLARTSDAVTLTPAGVALLRVRPWYELLVGGYSNTFSQLSTVLRSGASYATRDGAHVAVGSCGISEHDALPMVLSLLRTAPPHSAIVDIGCGDGTFVAELAAAFPGVSVLGVEPDRSARAAAEKKVAARHLTNVRVLAGDALHLPDEARSLPPGACFISAFVLQEVLEQSGESAVVDLLRRTFETDPTASWVVIEVDRRHPLRTEPSDLALAYYNPYYLLHRITEQRLLPLAQWRRIYALAAVEIVAEIRPAPDYDPLGLKFGHLLRASRVDRE